MRYFLSKADMVSSEKDRQKARGSQDACLGSWGAQGLCQGTGSGARRFCLVSVAGPLYLVERTTGAEGHSRAHWHHLHAQVVVQITQNLSSRIRNKHAFELPSLYIPDKACHVRTDEATPSADRSRPCMPRLLPIEAGGRRCQQDRQRARGHVQGGGAGLLLVTCPHFPVPPSSGRSDPISAQTIKASVQNNLDKLEYDCRLIGSTIDGILSSDASARKRNAKRRAYGTLTPLKKETRPPRARRLRLNV